MSPGLVRSAAFLIVRKGAVVEVPLFESPPVALT
jgi:hypothetical protein